MGKLYEQSAFRIAMKNSSGHIGSAAALFSHESDTAEDIFRPIKRSVPFQNGLIGLNLYIYLWKSFCGGMGDIPATL